MLKVLSENTNRNGLKGLLKLGVSVLGDKYERGADAVAYQVAIYSERKIFSKYK